MEEKPQEISERAFAFAVRVVKLVASEIVPEPQLAPLPDEANQLTAILTTIVKKLNSP